MNEDEILELTYRNPIKVNLKEFLHEEILKLSESQMTSKEKIAHLEKLKLEILAKNPQIMGVPIPDTHTKKGIMTRYGKKLLREGAKYYERLSVDNFKI